MEKFPDMQGKYREFGNFLPLLHKERVRICIVLNLVMSPKFPKNLTGKTFTIKWYCHIEMIYSKRNIIFLPFLF